MTSARTTRPFSRRSRARRRSHSSTSAVDRGGTSATSPRSGTRPSGSTAARASARWRGDTRAARSCTRTSWRSRSSRRASTESSPMRRCSTSPPQELPRVLGGLQGSLKPRGVLFSSNPRGENAGGMVLGEVLLLPRPGRLAASPRRGRLRGAGALLSAGGQAAPRTTVVGDRVAPPRVTARLATT